MNFAGAIYNGNVKVKNIIFDWGGVITDLHFEVTKKAFQDLGVPIFDESVPHDPDNDLFIPFEIGKISADQFRNRIRSKSPKPISDETINTAWISILGDLPPERWRILDLASKHYRTFLLSNTNSIHQPYYYGYIQKVYGTYGYAHFFEKTYFSHEIGMRKPDAEIYEYVLKDAGIKAGETMFIDDFIENIEAAKKLGFQTIHLQPPYNLCNIFEFSKV